VLNDRQPACDDIMARALSHAQLQRYYADLASRLRLRTDTFRAALAGYFGGLATRLSETEPERRAERARAAPAFNVFEYLKHQGLDEIGLSRLLANLLDPYGIHGQGDKFLNMFLRDIAKTDWVCKPETRIIREDLTRFSHSPGRRIDITIHLGSRGIGVENKPWAGEGEDQIKDYKEHLAKKYKGNFCLLYLSGSGAPPKSLSKSQLRMLSKSGKFRIVTYHTDLAEWMKSCQKVCPSDHVRWFLEDFHNYIRDSFPTDGEDD
jgi:hypothetical protein